MQNWIFKFQSNRQVHGIKFAANQAAKAGVPCSIVIQAMRNKLI